MSFVCDHYRKNAMEIGQIPTNLETSVIPNVLNVSKDRNPRNDNFAIGFVGMVPAKKG